MAIMLEHETQVLLGPAVIIESKDMGWWGFETWDLVASHDDFEGCGWMNGFVCKCAVMSGKFFSQQ